MERAWNWVLRLAAALVLATGLVPVAASPAAAAATPEITGFTVSPSPSPTGETVSVTVAYRLTQVTSADEIHVEVDLRDPFLAVAGVSPLVQPGTTILPLGGGCVDGYGLDTSTPSRGCRTVRSPDLNDGQSSTTGTFTFEARSADGVVDDGTVWDLDARLLVEGGGTVVASDAASTSVTLQAGPPEFSIRKVVSSVVPGTEPGGSASGYFVTYRIEPRNDAFYPAAANRGGSLYAAGTTEIVDTLPPGAVNPTVTRVGSNPAGWTGVPAFDALQPNSNFSVSTTSTTVTVSIDNLLTGAGSSGDYASFELEVWLPLVADADNTAEVVWRGASQASNSALLQLGPANLEFDKYHYCLGGYPPERRTAHLPAVNDNTDCYATPTGSMVTSLKLWAVDPTNSGVWSILVDPRIVDRLDPDTQLASDLFDVRTDPARPRRSVGLEPPSGDLNGWEVGYSTDPACDETRAMQPTFRSFAANPPTSLADVRCVEFTFAGVPSTPSYWPVYEVELRDPTASTVDDPGEYLHTTNEAWVTAANATEVNGAAVPQGGYGRVELTSTWWNAAGIAGLTKGIHPYQQTRPVLNVGDDVTYRLEVLGERPSEEEARQLSTEGWQDVVVTDQLPPEVRLRTPGLADLTFVELPEDATGTPVTPMCTIGSGGTGLTCAFGGSLPYRRPSSSSIDPGGPNEAVIDVAATVVGGLPGQIVDNDAEAWNGIAAYPNGSRAHNDADEPMVAELYRNRTKELVVGGLPQLSITKAPLASAVLPGDVVDYEITYESSGTAATTDTYVYDLLGGVGAGCTSARPTLASLPTQTSGDPAREVAYTTDANPSSASTWTTTAPPLAQITGVRWQLGSSVVPTPGYYSPTDPPGTFVVSVVAPADPGADACNRAELAAAGVPGASDEAAAAIVVPAPAVSITKDVQASPIASGGDAIFDLVVTNTGNVDLFSVVVSDPLVPACDLDISSQLGGPLVPGASAAVSWSCTVPGVTSSFTNTATVDALDAFGTAVTDSDDAEVVVAHPAVSITKDVQASPIASGGDATFDLVVTNTGDVDLFSVVVSDPLVPACDLDISSQLGGPLVPGASAAVSWSCTVPGVTSSFTNTATVDAVDGLGTPVSDADDALVEVVHPAIDVVKSPDLQTVRAGDPVGFTISVTNVGDIPLTSVSVADPLVAACDHDVTAALGGLLLPGQTYTYGCQLAAATSSFTNIAIATGSGAVGGPVSDLDPADVVVISPALEIVKSAVDRRVRAGDDATFDITVTNVGDVALDGVVVDDPLAPGCDRAIGTLPVGASVTYRCTRPSLGATLTNIANATGTAPDGRPVGDSDDATVEVIDPAIAIDKSPDQQVIADGGTATFTISVTNPGDDPLLGVSVSDPASPDCDRSIGILAPGQTVTYSCERTGVTANFTNTATVSGLDSLGGILSHADTADVTVRHPAIEITKTAEASPIPSGGTAAFLITVVNRGDVDLAAVAVADPLAPSCDRTIGSLAIGQAVTYRCEVAGVTATLHNVATATGTDDVGQDVSDDDDAVVETRAPAVSIAKTADPDHIEGPGEVTFTIEVTNTGDADLLDVVVDDPSTPGCGAVIGTLAVGEVTTYSCTATGVDESFTNVATVEGHDDLGQEFAASDEAPVVVDHPAISIDKEAGTGSVPYGGTASWTIVVANTGDVDLAEVYVTDPASPDCNVVIGALAVGDEHRHTCTTDGIAGTFTNVATAVGRSPLDTMVSATDEAVVVVEATAYVPPSSPLPFLPVDVIERQLPRTGWSPWRWVLLGGLLGGLGSLLLVVRRAQEA